MRGDIKVTFSDKVGLQWMIKLRQTRDPKADAERWLRIRELWHRIAEPDYSEPDGEGVDFKPDPLWCGEHSDCEVKPWAESTLGVPREYGNGSTGGGRFFEEVLPRGRTEDDTSGHGISGMSLI